MILQFTIDSPKILNWITHSMKALNEFFNSILKALKAWPFVYKFIWTIKIEGKFNNYVKKYETKSKEFYDGACQSYLCNEQVIRETLYMHVIRFYVPPVSKEMYIYLQYGYDIFSMQVTEKRNHKCKWTFHKYKNKKTRD